MSALEKRIYADSRAAGVSHALWGSALGVVAGRVVSSSAVATGISVGARALRSAAREVDVALADGDLPRARELLPNLVGRDPSDLDANEIARAVVESVAENTVDAVVAPALWGAVAGASGALGYRAVNSLDAVVGHHSPRYENYGWASAHLDDVVNFVPARVTAALVALVRPNTAGRVARAVTSQAPEHPSPNAGVAEAAFAAALGVTLGGANRYGERVEVRPALGFGRPARASDIARAIALSRDVTTALALTLGALGLALRGATR